MKKALGLLVAFYLAVVLPLTAMAQNRVQNPGFESDSEGWFGRGDATIVRSDAAAHSGNWSLQVSNRSQTWQGPAYALPGQFEVGRSYRVSAWIRLAAGEPQPLGMTVLRTDASGDRYANLISSRGFADRWVQLVEVYEHRADGAVTRLDLYFEGPAAGVDFYLDDVVVEALPEDWETAANERIEQFRKRNLEVQVLDAGGQPLAGAQVTLKQTRRHFPIGTAISAGAHAASQRYRDYAAAHFNWAVHENAAKWYANEPLPGVVTYEDADAVLDWAHAHGIAMRGHTVFWAPERWQPSWVPGLDDATLLMAVENRLADAVTHFRGRFHHWDVNNEMLHGSFFRDRLGEDIRQWMFEGSRAIDPDAALYVNDYNVLSSSETDLYVLQVEDFLQRGFPIDGIGMQGHMGEVNPWQIQTRLDKMAQFGLPIWVTEFDVERADENARADALETFFRSAYSHPAVEGIMLWGFWAGAHWRGPDAALVDQDWRVNAAGQRLEGLLAEWRSERTVSTNANGVAAARVFHGEYEVRVMAPDGSKVALAAEVSPGAGPQRLFVALGETAAPLIRVQEFGTAGAGTGQFDSPRGLAVDPLGRIVVADALNDRIQICSRDGTCQAFGASGTQPGQFCAPLDVAVDSRGRILVADSCNHRVQVCETGGACTAFGGLGQFDNPGNIAVLSDDRVVVGDTFNGRIQVCDRDGNCDQLGSLVDDPDAFQRGEIGFIQGVATDQQDRILLTEDIGGTARKALQSCYRDECQVVRTFDLPRDVAVDRFNRIHVIEDSRLQRCDHAGHCVGIDVPDPLRAGSRLAFTAANELVISDPEDNRIRVYAARTATPINAGFTDAWFNPETNGQGFFINVFPDLGTVFVGWFTFDTEQPPPAVGAHVGAPGQRWLTAQGNIRDNRAELEIDLARGGVFGSGTPAPEHSGVGRMILQFDGCRRGTVSYELPGINAWLRVIPIERIVESRVSLCEAAL